MACCIWPKDLPRGTVALEPANISLAPWPLPHAVPPPQAPLFCLCGSHLPDFNKIRCVVWEPFLKSYPLVSGPHLLLGPPRRSFHTGLRPLCCGAWDRWVLREGCAAHRSRAREWWLSKARTAQRQPWTPALCLLPILSPSAGCCPPPAHL